MSQVDVSADQVFAAVDRVVTDMTPAMHACSTCMYADVPPMPTNIDDGWVATCLAPIPVNILLHVSRVQRTFAAADAARWESKRQKSCPSWQAKDDAHD